MARWEISAGGGWRGRPQRDGVGVLTRTPWAWRDATPGGYFLAFRLRVGVRHRT